MALKPKQQPALSHDQRVRRLRQLTGGVAKAIDLAEEQRRLLGDPGRETRALTDPLPAAHALPVHPPRRKRR
jgi:hypothetical protein